MEIQKQHGIKPILVLGVDNSNIGINSAPIGEELEAFGKYVSAFVSDVKEYTNDYEVLNEVNWAAKNYEDNIQSIKDGTKLVFGPDEYFEVLKVAHDRAVEVNPDSRIYSSFGAMVYNNDERLDMLKWLERILELGAVDYMDAISFHIYTSPNTPEASPSKTVVVDDIRTILEKYDCADMPIRITEIGYSSDKAVDINGAVSGDYSELQQAMYSLRDLAMLYDKNLEAIQFYNAIEKQDGDSEQDNFGLINTWTDDYVYNASGVAYSAKPVFVSLVNFNTLLSNAVLESKKQIKNGNYVYKFITKNEGEVYMLWNSKDMSSVEVLNIPSDLVYVYDMYGNSRILRSTSQNYTIDISGEPTYVVVPKNTLYIPCDSLGNHLDYYNR